MKVAVVKFGGTSISTPEGREWAYRHVSEILSTGHRIVVVASAMGRMGDSYSTDTLLSLVDPQYTSERERDLLMSCGEVISSVVLTNFLKYKGLEAVPLTGWQAGILTDDSHGNGSIKKIDDSRLMELLSDGKIPVVTGFQGRNEDGEIVTLGRGGSDLTAIALASALRAQVVELYKDVDGVMTLDPKKNPEAKVIRKISAAKLLSMALEGSRVVHYEAIKMAADNLMSFRLRNNFSNGPGTLVIPEPREFLEIADGSE